MRLVFFGTAEFAVASLEALVTSGHEVLAVVTAPDKPAGRGYQLKGSPVKEAALRLNLPLLQPDKLKAPDFLAELAHLAPELQVVVAFRMMPEVVWAAPPHGTINVHGSLLPAYRGAAPIHWAVANGETVTGVTTFFLRHEIDTGDLILQKSTPISPEETTGEVYDRLMALGAEALIESVALIESGKALRIPQTFSGDQPHAPKITTENSQVHFDWPTERVRNLIRGMNPFPVAWCEVGGQRLKLYASRHPDDGQGPQQEAEPGTFQIDKGRFYIRCSDGWLELTELQAEGKKRMSGTDFANGAGRSLI